MDLFKRKKMKGTFKGKRAILFSLTFIVIYFLLITAIAPKTVDLKVGDIAKSDIKAPKDTVDEVASKVKEQEVIEKVDKQYALKTEVKIQAEDNIQNFLEKINNLNSTQEDIQLKILELKKIPVVSLTDEEYKAMIALSKNQIIDLEHNLLTIINEVYKSNISDENSEELENAKKTATDMINRLEYNQVINSAIQKLVLHEIKPNFFYDSEKTDQLIKEAQKGVQKVIIKKNQIIVKEGEPVTAAQIAVLESLGLIDSNNRGYILLCLIVGAYLALILLIEYYYIYANYNEIFENFKSLLLISITNIISLVLAASIRIISPFLIPFICGPILLTMLINYKVSMVINALNVLLIAVIVNFDPQVIILALLCSLLGSTALRKMQQRNDILFTSAIIAAVAGVFTLTSGILLSNNLKEIFLFTLFSVIGVIISAVFALGILPFLEFSFDVVTPLKLLELSNPNHPLLKKLLMEAPGTYHHSMLVANLAEMAAEKVGANPIIARIGAYYHDVGKTRRPYFFSENQISKDNPHNKINPTLSTLIIHSHVKDGLELAKEYKIPTVIQDIIAQHHGTTLVKFFYYKLKNSSENPEEINEEDFRYSGPIPESKEAGIIMLSDSVEAAVRSIPEPTKGKIEEMVNNIIQDKLHSGQLDKCDLTLKDLDIIRQGFLKTLNGIYHQRVEYPTEKK